MLEMHLRQSVRGLPMSEISTKTGHSAAQSRLRYSAKAEVRRRHVDPRPLAYMVLRISAVAARSGNAAKLFDHLVGAGQE
jgi:hypothetical protein